MRLGYLKSLLLVVLALGVLEPLISSKAYAAETVIEPKIVGGKESGANDWPWMVALSRSDSTAGTDLFQNQFCGASLINQSWVLTAAHCVVDSYGVTIPADELHAFVGEYDLSQSTGHYRSISLVVVHPNYTNISLDNDIALLKLSSPVAGVDVMPVSFANPTSALLLQPDVGQLVSVIGWGDTDGSSIDVYPNVLRDVEVPYISNQVCNDAITNGTVTANMMCAGLQEGGKDACQGDSGGPLVFSTDGGASWIQAGIVSWGDGCAKADAYGVYTRVENYSDWIQKALTITPEVRFGSWIDGKVYTAQVEISNSTGSTFIISDIVSTDDLIFSLSPDTINCIKTYNSGDSCIVNLSFVAPATPGDYSGSLSVVTDQLGTITVDLNGTVIVSTTLDNVVNDGSVASTIGWAMAGAANWQESIVTTDGGYSLESGNITNNQFSSLFAFISVPTGMTQRPVYFDWKVCSEPNWDYLELWVDNVKQDALSGNADWTRKLVTLVGEGDHVIEWRYNKDVIYSFGADAGWLDNITLDVESGNLKPVHASSCDLTINDVPVQSSGGGGGAISTWLYLGLGLPLLMRRRITKH